jgi:hypothetical protein
VQKSKVQWIGIFTLISVAWLASCSKEAAQQPAPQASSSSQASAQQQPTGAAAQSPQTGGAQQQTAAPAQSAQSSSAGAASNSGTRPSGPPATEKHWMKLTNYAGTAVTVSINGVWVGQWDTHSGDIPLESVVQGKNDVTIELQGQPQSGVTLEVYAQRAGGGVNLLRLNFQGKTGTQNYSFVAR